MSNSVSVVFDADTGRFQANVNAAGQSVSKASEAIAAAKNKILDSFNAQVAAATKTGASAQQLATIQTKAAQSMASVTETNADKVVRSLDRIAERQRAVTAQLANLKVPEVKESSDISDRMRASALLRGGGLRAAENFASQFQSFNQIATLAFPILGLATLGEAAVKFGKELYEAFDLGGNRARQTASEILGVSNALRDSNTSLDVQIDKLAEEEAKLAKKPYNGLKLALDEAAQASENLQKKLEANFSAELKVLAGMSASLPQRLLTGGSNTHQEQVMLGEHNRHTQEAGDIQGQYSESQSYAGALQTRLAELQRMKKTNEDTQLSAAESGSGGTAILTHYDEEIKAVQTLISWQRQEQAGIVKTIDLQKQEAATQTARDKAEASRIAKEGNGSANKANEARLKGMEAYVATWKTQAPVTAKAIYDYWELQKSTFSTKSSEFQSIVAKQADIAEAGARVAHEQMQKLRQSLKTDSDGTPAGVDRNVNFIGNSTESARSLNRSNLTGTLGDAEAQASVAKATVGIQQASGAISKLTADQRLAAIEADLHAKRLKDLNDQLADLQKNSDTYNSVTGKFASDKDQEQANALRSQMVKESASASVDAMKSAADIAGQTWSVALKDANAQWLQDSQDTAKQVVQLATQAREGFNNSLTGLITGDRSNGRTAFQTFRNNLGQTGMGLSRSLANNGLNRVESSLFGSAFGKPDGSSSKPLNVKIVGGLPGMSGTGFGSLFSQSSSTGSSSTTQSAVGGIGGFFASLFGGGRAVGGGVTSGTTYLVGEAGAELFSPSTSGTIIPNHALSGGNAYYNVQVANGVTPEQMNMHMETVLRQYHGQVAKTSVAANKDHAQRRPASAR